MLRFWNVLLLKHNLRLEREEGGLVVSSMRCSWRGPRSGPSTHSLQPSSTPASGLLLCLPPCGHLHSMCTNIHSSMELKTNEILKCPCVCYIPEYVCAWRSEEVSCSLSLISLSQGVSLDLELGGSEPLVSAGVTVPVQQCPAVSQVCAEL